MPAHVTLVLTGGRAGKTCSLLQRQFVDGELTLRAKGDDIKELAGLIKYMGVSYKAFPEGSEDLAHYQKLDEEAGRGVSKIHASGQSGTDDQVRSGVSEDESPSADAGTEDSGGDDDPESGDVSELPDGDGQEKSEDEKLIAAIRALDPDEDDHWTQDKRPAVASVEEKLGGLTSRHDIERVAPEYKRPKD